MPVLAVTGVACAHRCFSASSVEEIVARLKAEGTAWTDGLVATLAKMSPTSMKITFEQVSSCVLPACTFPLQADVLHCVDCADSSEQAPWLGPACLFGHGAAHGPALHGGAVVAAAAAAVTFHVAA